MLSILRMSRLEQAMPQSLRGGIRRLCHDLSMDRVERANFEYLSATCYLPRNLSTSCREWQRYKVTDASTCSCSSCPSFDVSFLTLSQTQKLLVVG